VFSTGDRDSVRQRILGLARTDDRVVAGAVLGSLAHHGGDRWSDIDLMFAVAHGIPVEDILNDWTRTITQEFEAVRLFDLPSGSTTYRVFVFPNLLELDLSMTPASDFGPEGPTFRVLFGEAVLKPEESATPAEELFGFAVHHALHARAAIERGRHWQAEYWISAVRDYALHLACRRRGLDGWYGRDFDQLPSEVREPAEDALIRSLEESELRRALRAAVTALLHESGEAADIAERVRDLLHVVSDSAN
jgi:hypothetical protein